MTSSLAVAIIATVLWSGCTFQRTIIRRMNRNLHTSITSYSSTHDNDDSGLPRLQVDTGALSRWIERNNGCFGVQISQRSEGWTLLSCDKEKKGSELIIIPKPLCIFSDPSKMKNSLLVNNQKRVFGDL